MAEDLVGTGVTWGGMGPPSGIEMELFCCNAGSYHSVCIVIPPSGTRARQMYTRNALQYTYSVALGQHMGYHLPVTLLRRPHLMSSFGAAWSDLQPHLRRSHHFDKQHGRQNREGAPRVSPVASSDKGWAQEPPATALLARCSWARY